MRPSIGHRRYPDPVTGAAEWAGRGRRAPSDLEAAGTGAVRAGGRSRAAESRRRAAAADPYARSAASSDGRGSGPAARRR